MYWSIRFHVSLGLVWVEHSLGHTFVSISVQRAFFVFNFFFFKFRLWNLPTNHRGFGAFYTILYEKHWSIFFFLTFIYVRHLVPEGIYLGLAWLCEGCCLMNLCVNVKQTLVRSLWREMASCWKGNAVPLRGCAHVSKVSACVVSPNSPLTKQLRAEWRVSGLVTRRG